MGFQELAKVETADWYIDLAFRTAKKNASEMKKGMRAAPDTIKNVELAKLDNIRKVLNKHLDRILTTFPKIHELTVFYQELMATTLDIGELKKSLGAVKWAMERVNHFSDVYSNRMRHSTEFRRMLQYAREYYGRISSVMKQVKQPLLYIEQSRRIMREYPSIKSGMLTVTIAGFPNVGKTTLLSKITGSTPEIANYAFTTRRLNVGYAKFGETKVQFIDTPGTFDRFEKMNMIEKQAYLAMKHCADIIVFVFDQSDQSYDADKQLKLLENTKEFGKDILIYVSKTDLEGKGVPKKIGKLKTCFSEIGALTDKIKEHADKRRILID